MGESVSPRLNPAVGEVPHDFSNIGYTSLESKLDPLAHGTDEWANQVDPTHLIPRRDRSALASRQTGLEDWWGQAQPRMNAIIEPWTMRYMDAYMDANPEPSSADLLKRALAELPQQGSSEQRLLAEEGLTYLESTKDGHQAETQSYWGDVLRRGDFPARDSTLRDSTFRLSIISIQDAMVRTTGNFENVERNQCVVLHLSSGILRSESGRPRRVPDRGRVSTLAQELRRLEVKTPRAHREL